MTLFYYNDLTLSQTFQPMAAQLSKKAALPLAKILESICNMGCYPHGAYLAPWHLQQSCLLTDVIHPVNSSFPGKSGCDFKTASFNLVLFIGIFRSYDNALTVLNEYHWASLIYVETSYGAIRPKWVNSILRNCYVRMSVNKVIIDSGNACCLFSAKPLSKLILTHSQLHPWGLN